MFDELLKKYGNQSKVAEALGVTPMAVSKWYTGKTHPSRKTAQKIADELGISLGDVFDNNGSGKKGGRNDRHEKSKR